MRKNRLLVTLLALLAVVGFGVVFVQAAAPGLRPSYPAPVVPAPPPSVVEAPPEPGPGGVALRLQIVADHLEAPVAVATPTGDDRLFVAQKNGEVRVVVGGRLLEEPFLDLTHAVNSDGIERGLLGLAFHPHYADEGRLFVDYTARNGDTRVVEFRADRSDPNRADPDSARIVLAVPQPQQFHNGGMLQFGPGGHLYVGMGDGGGIGDEFGNAQRNDILLGSILRIDVDRATPYGIPADNPFAEGGGAPEVWMYGLRNPWRFWIDAAEGLLYVGDVGQFSWEEIDVVPVAAAGTNFGWPVMEADTCYDAEECDEDGLHLPTIVYGRNPGCAVIGGVVYWGEAIPEMRGHYFYGDFCDGFVRSFRFEDGAATLQRDWSEAFGEVGQILSFGTDGAGEIYVATASTVYRIEAARTGDVGDT